MTSQNATPGIAVIGYGVRASGVSGPEAFWQALLDRRCTITDIPGSRWSRDRFTHPDPSMPGTTYVARAGIVPDLFEFDAEFFGISPREAVQIDPQQRLLMEVTWEALDHAGLRAETLAGDGTGIFIGASSLDHGGRFAGGMQAIDSAFMLGNTLSIHSNRLSYLLDAKGPSYTVDTACSSSAFALHQACEALRSGEIDTAIVGGVNALLSPLPFIGFARAAMLSPDGLCQAFSANANGYVRAEGAAVFVLKRSGETEGLRTRSVILGTGTNTDGRTGGMSMPSPEGQAALIRRIATRLNLDPNDLAFVEAHGTGTPVGDPVEAQAIGSVYGKGRGTPLPIGSAKTNFGHLEPGSGLIGLLKAQLALENDLLPATLHAEDLNPHIPFDALRLTVATDPVPLEPRKRPWLAAVNSFGFGGANAHIVLRQPWEHENPARPDVPPAISSLMLSAATADSLTDLAASWAATLSDIPASDAAIRINNANHHLTRHRHRVLLSGDTPAEIATAASRFSEGAECPTIQTGLAYRSGPVGFLYSGNGAQWAGMGRHLFETDPVFREAFDRVSGLVVDWGGPNLRDLIVSATLEQELKRSTNCQPLNFALQVALTEALRQTGLVPTAIAGHSAGEVAAAWASGGLSLEDAVHLICPRAVTLEAIRGTGSMAAVLTDRATCEKLLTGLALEISAENSPRSLTVSGPVEDLKLLATRARKSRVAAKILDIDYPYHSVEVERVEDRLRADLSRLRPQPSEATYYSSTHGRAIDTTTLDADYWWQNARQPVRFRAAVEAMIADGIQVLVEIGARTVLKTYVTDTIEAAGSNAVHIRSLDPGPRETVTPRQIAAEAVASGAIPAPRRFWGPPVPFQGGLPRYPWAHETHAAPLAEDAIDLFGGHCREHPLIGHRLRPGEGPWHATIDPTRLPWLADHKVDGVPVLPAAALFDILAEAGRETFAEPVEITDADLLHAVTFPENQPVDLRTTLEPATGAISIETRRHGAGQDWTPAAAATLRPCPPGEPLPFDDAPEGPLDLGWLYGKLEACALSYGPAFRLIDMAAVGPKTARVTLCPPVERDHSLSPFSLDSALHVFYPLIDSESVKPLKPGETILPLRAARIRVLQPGTPASEARLRLSRVGDREAVGDVQLLAATGEVTTEITGLRLQKHRLAGAKRRAGAWHTTPTRLRPGTPVALPEVWCDPMARAADLGLLAGDDTPLTDAAILIDAAARRLTRDALAGIAALTGNDPLERLCLDALASDGEAERSGNGHTLSAATSYPDFDTILAELTRLAPDRAPEIAALGKLRLLLPAALAGEPTRPAKPAGPTAFERALWDRTARLADDLIAKWHPGERLILGLTGTPPRALLSRLLEACDGIVLPGGYAPLAHPRLSTDPSREVDILIETGIPLPDPDRRLAPGGLVLTLSHGPDLFQTLHQSLICGQALPTATGAPLAIEEGDATLAAAITPAAATALPDLPDLHVIGSAPGLEDTGPAAPDWVLVAEAGPDSLATTSETFTRLQDALSDARPDRLWLLTDAAAGLSGLCRTLCNEGIAARLLETPLSETLPEILARAIAFAGDETEIRIDPATGAWHAPRIEPVPLPARQEGDAWHLTQSRENDLDALTWDPARRRAPDPGEVEVDIAATGLNFRDVLWAQGLLPEEALADGFTGPALGMECAGRVTRSADPSLPEGTEVMGFAPAAFSSHLTGPARSFTPIPPGLTAAQAATIPTIFVTALYAIENLANLRKGETILIHGAAGGVGLAALQVARRTGARILATAGTEEKRTLLRRLGADAVFSSRDTGFADAVRAAGGADVVLNSLAGEAMARSLDCLRPFGRFVELGKRDLYANSRLGLRPFRRNLSYFALDADQLFSARPDLLETLLARLQDGFATGAFTVPPHQVFAAEDAVDAFRLMQRAGHIGKILISPPRSQPKPLEMPDYSGTWLITGGLGGFGIETAIRLAENGADRLILTSRRGSLPDAARARLEATGAAIEPVAADVTDAGAMAALIDRIGPLTGIVHAPMVLEDRLFADLDAARTSRVLAPKIKGLDILEAATRATPPRYFVCYSSLAALIGNPGQSAYATANAYLDARMRARRAAGLHGLAIGWGPIGDVGVLAGDPAEREMMAKKLGAPLLSSTEALDALEDFLRSDNAVVTFTAMNWGRMAGDLPLLQTPLTERLDLARTGAESAAGLAEMIAGLAPDKALKKVTDLLRDEAAAILRLAPSDLDPLRPLAELGFDSLMALNLRMVAEEKYGVQLPLISLMDGTTLAQAAAMLMRNEAGETASTVSDLHQTHVTGGAVPDEIRREIESRAANLKNVSNG